jgi:hypothetical protein
VVSKDTALSLMALLIITGAIIGMLWMVHG